MEQAVDQAKGNNPDVGNIIETAMARVQAVVVVFSPDELAHLKEQFWVRMTSMATANRPVRLDPT